MEIVLRAAAVYVVLFVYLRASGKRSMSKLTAFDFVLLLIVSEASQQALLGDDFSVTGGALAVLTLLSLDRVSDWLSSRSDRIDQLLSDGAVILVEHGEPHQDRMKMLRIQDDDVLEEARSSQGLERMDQIKYAVLERTGSISIIPRQR